MYLDFEFEKSIQYYLVMRSANQKEDHVLAMPISRNGFCPDTVKIGMLQADVRVLLW